MELLIKNGTVINADGRINADVAVNDGKIIKIERNIKTGAGTEVVDASGLLVLPGAVDVHTHFELSFGSFFSSADDFYSGTRAAACGGVTTIIDFVTPEKSDDTHNAANEQNKNTRSAAGAQNDTNIATNAQNDTNNAVSAQNDDTNNTAGAQSESFIAAFNKRKASADPKVCIDYGLHMGISEINDRLLEEMEEVVKVGVSSFKVFMTYAFKLTEKEFARTLTRAKDIGAITMVHAEDHEMLEALKAKFISEGKTDAWHHYLSRPEAVEAKAVDEAIELAKNTGATLYIVHLACAEGLKAVEKAQAEGYPIYAETCPQYLNFTCDVYKRPDGRNFICSPPMKGKKSRDALWESVISPKKSATRQPPASPDLQIGINTLATDHCPFQTTDKDRGKDDFTQTPNGVMGVENLYPYMLSEANKGIISFERVIELCATNPAKIFNLNQKGAIKPGKDADIVLYDPGENFIISQKNMHSTIDYTIWEGLKLKGYPVQTYSRGILIFKDGVFSGKPGHGRFIKRFRDV